MPKQSVHEGVAEHRQKERQDEASEKWDVANINVSFFSYPWNTSTWKRTFKSYVCKKVSDYTVKTERYRWKENDLESRNENITSASLIKTFFVKKEQTLLKNEGDVSATNRKKEQEKERDRNWSRVYRSLSSEYEYLLSHTQTRTLLAVLRQYRSCATHYSRFFCTHLLVTLHYSYLADADQRSD